MPRISQPWFTIAFSLSYIVIFALDLPLFVYHPLVGEFRLRPLADAASGPAMHWYGLVAGAGIVGLVAGVLGRDRWIPETWVRWLWLTPMLAMLVSAYLLRQFFI